MILNWGTLHVESLSCFNQIIRGTPTWRWSQTDTHMPPEAADLPPCNRRQNQAVSWSVLLELTHVPLQLTLHCNYKLPGVRFIFGLPPSSSHEGQPHRAWSLLSMAVPDTWHDTRTTEGPSEGLWKEEVRGPAQVRSARELVLNQDNCSPSWFQASYSASPTLSCLVCKWN